MKKTTIRAILLMAILFIGVHTVGWGASFTQGNIVVLRVGDGVAALSAASAAVFLDEYTPAGTFVQTIAIPTSGANMLSNAGSTSSEGLMTLSPDGQYLTLAGYNAAPATAAVAGTTSATVNRKLLRVDNAVNYTPILSSRIKRSQRVVS